MTVYQAGSWLAFQEEVTTIGADGRACRKPDYKYTVGPSYSTNRVIIRNGVVGSSSHNGIHGGSGRWESGTKPWSERGGCQRLRGMASQVLICVHCYALVSYYLAGNGGNINTVLEDLVVRDFEVAGIQFNGAKGLTIRRSTVGPSGKALVMGTMSSARFIGFWFAFIWVNDLDLCWGTVSEWYYSYCL